tara:strand:+ start:59 stop:322 length:264 start_codon:yes stop_codon:yes gene_type:complete
VTPRLRIALLLSLFAGLALVAGCNEFDDGRVCPMMTARQAKTNISVAYEGNTFYVCCKKCKRAFDASPQDYIRLFRDSSGKRSPEDK